MDIRIENLSYFCFRKIRRSLRMIMGMKKLLSLPPNLVDCFHAIEHVSTEEWFCTSDPVGARLGSGGGLPAKRGPWCIRGGVVGTGEAYLVACRRAKPPFARICAIRENIDSDPCVSLGKRAEVIPELIVFAITSLWTDHEKGAGIASYLDR